MSSWLREVALGNDMPAQHPHPPTPEAVPVLGGYGEGEGVPRRAVTTLERALELLPSGEKGRPLCSRVAARAFLT